MDSLCCCEAEPLPHPNHDATSANPAGGGPPPLSPSEESELPLGNPPIRRLHPAAPPARQPVTGCYPGGIPGDGEFIVHLFINFFHLELKLIFD